MAGTDTTARKYSRFVRSLDREPSVKIRGSDMVGEETLGDQRLFLGDEAKKSRDLRRNMLEEEAEKKRPSNYQDVLDAKTRAKEDKAPTTKTEMGKPFKKGGSVKGWGKARGGRKCKVM